MVSHAFAYARRFTARRLLAPWAVAGHSWAKALIKRLAMTKTLHHRACHLCEAICGLTLETTQAEDGRLAITSIKGDPWTASAADTSAPRP